METTPYAYENCLFAVGFKVLFFYDRHRQPFTGAKSWFKFGP